MPTYEDIFKVYLDFCPYYRRRLYTITELINWLYSADLIPPYLRYNYKDSFFIFLDFLYRNDIVTPFFSKGIISNMFCHFIGEEQWKQDYKNDFIRFWDDNTLREKGLTYPYSFTELEERKIDLYFYHPLQIIEIMSFLVKMLKAGINIYRFEDFFEFYCYRMKEIKNNATDIVKLIPFYRNTLKRLLNNMKWLRPEWLRLYIKLEKIGHTNLYASGHTNDCKIMRVDDENEYEAGDNSSNVKIWFRNFKEQKKKHFSKDELLNLEHFAQYAKDISLGCDGLNQWSDLLCLIKNNKEKLKSVILYDVNVIQIANDLDRLYWYLNTDDLENDKNKPANFFKDNIEEKKYYQKVLYRYNLTPEPLFVVYVEGPTEMNVLKKWYRLRDYYQSFDVKKIRSKNLKEVINTLHYVVAEFKSKVCFYFFDDDENEPQNKDIKDVFNQFNINEERYAFFKPDFVTHNFTEDDIFKALCTFFKNEKLSINNDDLKKIREMIRESYLNNSKIEKNIEKVFFNNNYGPFSKDKFGNCLGDIVIEEIKKGENRKIFPFEDIFYNRFYKIAEIYLKK